MLLLPAHTSVQVQNMAVLEQILKRNRQELSHSLHVAQHKRDCTFIRASPRLYLPHNRAAAPCPGPTDCLKINIFLNFFSFLLLSKDRSCPLRGGVRLSAHRAAVRNKTLGCSGELMECQSCLLSWIGQCLNAEASCWKRCCVQTQLCQLIAFM